MGALGGAQFVPPDSPTGAVRRAVNVVHIRMRVALGKPDDCVLIRRALERERYFLIPRLHRCKRGSGGTTLNIGAYFPATARNKRGSCSTTGRRTRTCHRRGLVLPRSQRAHAVLLARPP